MSIYLYIYICIYVCLYMYICMRVCMCVYEGIGTDNSGGLAWHAHT